MTKARNHRKKETEMSDFASYLREARERAGLNQSELAAKVGLTGSYISVLESRKKPPPSDTVLERIAHVLGLSREEILEVAHLDRSPADIRERIRALDRHLRIERKLTKRLLTDVLPSSLWHFGRVQGFHEAALEKLRLDSKRKRVLRQILARLGPLTSRSDFEERSRALIDSLREEERSVLFELLPELVRGRAGTPTDGTSDNQPDSRVRFVPVLRSPPGTSGPEPDEVVEVLPVRADEHQEGSYFLLAPDRKMAPEAEPGDLLLVLPSRPPSAGDLALLRVEGETELRQVTAEGGELQLVIPGGEAEPIAVAAPSILGIVREIRKRL